MTRGPMLAAPIVAVVLAGCEILGLATPDPAADDARRLEAGRSTWAQAGIDDYSFTVRYGCFCPESVTGPFAVTVVDGVATDVRRTDGRPMAERPPDVVPLTVEAAFARAAEAVGASDLTITFDERWGFPGAVTVDPITNAVDEEWSFQLTDFTPAP